MKKLKILLVSQGFYPENSPRSFRATELAKEFALQGHDVTVLTNPKEFDLTEFANNVGIKIKYTSNINLSEINFGRIKGLLFYLNRLIVRFLLLFFEFPYIKLTFAINKALSKEYEKYNLLISFSVPYPVHWGVALSHKKRNWIADNWVADCGDPYYLDKLDSFKKPFYFKWIEKWMFNKVDFITVTRIDFKVNYFPEFHHKIVEIPQGFDFSKIQMYHGLYKQNVIPKFAFAGRFGGKSRDPKTLIYCLENISTNFKCIIYTENKNVITSILPENLKEKVIVQSFLPREDLLIELSKMDFLVNLEFNPLNQSPSKLIDYAITGRPIININKKTLVQDFEIFKEFLSGNYNNAFVVPELEKYNIKNVSQSFLTLAGF
ncbi:MAG: hypothetical protein ACK4K9_05585 [Bacteroidia bacterium]